MRRFFRKFPEFFLNNQIENVIMLLNPEYKCPLPVDDVTINIIKIIRSKP